ncbi:MAG: hypothetical protein JNK58_03360 [Phycisphaerae bacterium]|nr:hypothetical protein [Phycisphaerae bacterium]
MRGGFLHNKVLLAPILEHFFSRGAVVREEFPVVVGTVRRAVDLWILEGSVRIAIEAELTPRRAITALDKAVAAAATHLLIVTPTGAVADTIVESLHGRPEPESCIQVCVLPQGPALAWVRSRFPLISIPFRERKEKPKVNA